jgi:hypothetical protein
MLGTRVEPQIAIYTFYCGESFARHLAELLRGAGYGCELRPGHPQDYEHLPELWGRIYPGVLFVHDLEAQLRSIDVVIGDLAKRMRPVRARVADETDAVVHAAVATKFVKALEKVIAESEVRAIARAAREANGEPGA